MVKYDLDRTARNILVLQELKEILQAFAARGADTLVLKGCALLPLAYPHPGDRQMGDIDLLVREKDIAAAKEELLRRGYAPLKRSFRFFVKQSSLNFGVDLDHKMPYLRNEEELWREALPFPFAGTGHAFVLSPEEQLLYLCYHLAVSHADPQKKWFEDICRVVSHYRETIDWRKLTAKAMAYNLKECCYYTFQRAAGDFNASIPAQALESLRPRPGLKSFIFARVIRSSRPLGFDSFLPVLIRPQVIWHWGFPPAYFIEERYGLKMPLAAIIYLVRPLLLAFQGLKSLAGLVRQMV